MCAAVSGRGFSVMRPILCTPAHPTKFKGRLKVFIMQQLSRGAASASFPLRSPLLSSGLRLAGLAWPNHCLWAQVPVHAITCPSPSTHLIILSHGHTDEGSLHSGHRPAKPPLPQSHKRVDQHRQACEPTEAHRRL